MSGWQFAGASTCRRRSRCAVGRARSLWLRASSSWWDSARCCIGVVSRPRMRRAIATIATKAGAPVWSIEVFGTTNRVVMRVEGAPPTQSGRDYELWALPAGGKPVSLGVMPVAGSGSHELSAIQKAALANSPAARRQRRAGGRIADRSADRCRGLRSPAARHVVKPRACCGR